jgi:NSS family neurotransmitter:Na+ symporter
MLFTVIVCILGFGVCFIGLQKGVERITKWMMSFLLVIMVVLAIHSVTLDGAAEGLRFYLVPDFQKVLENGVGNMIFGAMSQAFFTLSIGIGSMAIFGSYLNKERSISGEAINILVLDTFVALTAGLIIIPACFAFKVDPSAGPGLVFVTLPNVFSQMTGGRIWGSLFFLFMCFAAFSTVIAVFENIICNVAENLNISRKKSIALNLVLVTLLSMPAVLGFNVLSGIQPLGDGTNVMDLEDFIVSNLLLPIGSLVFILFCTCRYGWGWKKFTAEANEGKGMKVAGWMRGYMSYVLPVVVVILFFVGLYNVFVK